MKSRNRNLTTAKVSRNDEFYTQYKDIEKEISLYRDCFRNKVVLCNCDNPDKSEFYRYFRNNFKELKLKGLISSYYTGEESTLWNFLKTEYAEYDGIKEIRSFLSGNGDFRSKEQLRLLEKADIIVTNPPFSLFNEFFRILMENKKDFLILGSQNAFVYSNVFPYLADGTVRADHAGSIEFITPEGDFKKFGNICWYTTLERKRYFLIFDREFKEEDFLRYYNFDGVYVEKLSDIPKGYKGAMGVPITFLYFIDFKRFKILGTSKDIGNPLGKEFMELYFSQGNKGHYTANMRILGLIDKEGKARIPFIRLIIKAI